MADPGEIAGKLGQRLIETVNKSESKDVSFDLDNWITDFEQGFQRFAKINPNFAKHNWGVPPEQRPRINELNEEADAQQVEGYRAIEFFPNRENKEESYILFGTPMDLITQVSLMMNQWLLLKSLDSDGWMGYPIDEYLRTKASNNTGVYVILTTAKQPPYRKVGTEPFFKKQVWIPRAIKSKFTYKAIREACGGNSGLNWGEWYARAYVSTNDGPAIHQMVASGSSEKEAIENLERFLPFTQCRVNGITVNKIDFTKGERAKGSIYDQRKKISVYPSWITVTNRKLIDSAAIPGKGTQTLSGKQLKKTLKLWIYPQNEPSGWSGRITDAFKAIQSPSS